MKSVIACSLNDPAGTNIRERLIDNIGFEESSHFFDSYPIYFKEETILVCSHKDIVFSDQLEEQLGEGQYIFVSKHRAESGIPSLTAHFTGNPGANLFGGNAGEIAHYSPSMLKNYLLHLTRAGVPEGFQITLEATHHGPTSLKSPLLFVELGSTAEQWGNVEAATAIAEAVWAAIKETRTYSKCAVGLGGTHYSDKFNRLLLESDLALGTIFPKYTLEHVDKKMLVQSITKSKEKISYAALDMKGLGAYKAKLLKDLEELGLELVKA